MVQFKWYKFSELTAKQVYDILALRSEIFVVEQKCVYQDPDGKDFFALHLIGMENDNLVAYIRLFPPDELNNNLVFGRVVTAKSVRAKGYGKQLLRALLNYCKSHFPENTIQCSAQHYLKKFYESFGFTAYGNIYLEDDIPHISMKKET